MAILGYICPDCETEYFFSGQKPKKNIKCISIDCEGTLIFDALYPSGIARPKEKPIPQPTNEVKIEMIAPVPETKSIPPPVIEPVLNYKRLEEFFMSYIKLTIDIHEAVGDSKETIEIILRNDVQEFINRIMSKINSQGELIHFEPDDFKIFTKRG